MDLNDNDTLDQYDLERYKDRIREMYVDKQLALVEVMRVLEREENCKASVNMYKKKLRKWRFDKNTKAEEKANRARREESSDDRALKVKKSQILESNNRKRFRKKKYLDFESCPSALFLYDDQRPRTKSSTISSIPSDVTLPETLKTTYSFFYLISELQTHIMEPLVFSRKLEDESDDIDYNQRLKMVISRRRAVRNRSYNPFYNDINSGLEVLKEGKLEASGALFERGFRSFEDALLSPTPGFGTSTLVLLIGCLRDGYPEVGEIMVRFLWAQAYRMFGPYHCLTRWGRYLHQNWNNIDALHRGILAFVGVSTTVAGQKDEWTLANRFGAVTIGAGLDGLSIDEIKGLHIQAISDYAESSQLIPGLELNPRLGINLKRSYADFLYDHGDILGAEKALADAPIWVEADYEFYEDLVVACYAMAALAMYKFLQGPEYYSQSEAMIRKLWKRASEAFGPESGVLVHLMRILAVVYKVEGKPEKADDQYQAILTVLEDFKLSAESPLAETGIMTSTSTTPKSS